MTEYQGELFWDDASLTELVATALKTHENLNGMYSEAAFVRVENGTLIFNVRHAAIPECLKLTLSLSEIINEPDSENPTDGQGGPEGRR